MHIIDIIIVGLYFVVCILIAIYRFKSVKTLHEYALGRNYFPSFVIISTILATFIGAGFIIGIVEKIHELGIFFIVPILCMPFMWLIMAEIFGKNISQFRNCMSIIDIMEILYGQSGRWIANISSILMSVTIITIQARMIGYIAHYFFQLPHFYGIIIGILVITSYSAFGGIRAISLTNVFQFTILIIVIPLSCSYAYHNAGGYEAVINSLPEKIRALDINRDNVLQFLSLTFFYLLPIAVGTPYIQRFLISNSTWQLVKCMRIIAVIHLLFIIIICLIGIIIKFKAPDIDSSIAFFYFIENHLHIGIKGLAIAGILAIAISTADSWLNATSVVCAHNIIGRSIPLTDKQSLLVARLSTFVISFLAIFLSMYKKGIIEFTWLMCNFWEPTIIVPITAGFLKFRTNAISFIASVIVGITFTCISGYIVGEFATISLMYGIIGNFIGLFGMHYLQRYQGIDPKSRQLVHRTSSADIYYY